MADTHEIRESSTPTRERGPPKKRRRVVISCTECHRRKQKCDRDLPCANCRSRNKENACVYETGAPTARDQEKLQKASPALKAAAVQKKNDETLSSMAATWGYSQTGTSTIGFLKRIETADDDDEAEAPSRLPLTSGRHDSLVVKEKYKGLIRQLPAKVYIDQLIDVFMDEFNWQYYMVDPEVFKKQLDEWNKLPFSVLSSSGPQALSPDLRVFPAVLFHMIATALLSLSEGPHPVFDALKYAGNMTFEDLAADYSESGAAIVNLFGKKSLSLTTVLAEFLRASFLKFTGNVTESWHAVSVTIRDAQELGMHRDNLDPKPADYSTESILENQWVIQRRRKMYMILVIWDINMSLVLGRPGVVDARHGFPSVPIDAVLPKDMSKTPVVPRDELTTPPTPLTRGLWQWKLSEALFDIRELEEDGPYPKDFSKVDRVHQKILAIEDCKPAVFRLKNPDRRWDDEPGMKWLQALRFYVAQLHEFNLMALHRPYIFHRRESRSEALKASIEMLEIQRLTFEGLPPESWRNFTLFFGSFDAVVLIASVYILFPTEHPELREVSLQQFQWTIERFTAMQERNPFARSAQGVLKAILAKVNKAISNAEGVSPNITDGGLSTTPASTRGTMETTPGSSFSRATAGSSSVTSGTTIMGDAASSYPPPPGAGTDWAMPSAESLASLAPMFPTSDLIYHDLNAVFDDGLVAPPLGDQTGLEPGSLSWQFGGDFAEDTFWQFLNQQQLSTAG